MKYLRQRTNKYSWNITVSLWSYFISELYIIFAEYLNLRNDFDDGKYIKNELAAYLKETYIFLFQTDVAIRYYNEVLSPQYV